MINNTIALAMTGASGMPYGLRLLEQLLEAEKTVYLMISDPGRLVLQQECDLHLSSRPVEIQNTLYEKYECAENQLQVFGKQDWYAPVASGSGVPDAMVICPCTSGTLASVAAGSSNNLIERAADVVIKERKQLLIVPREMPYSTLHLENMLRLSRLGVTIMPPNPGFYHSPDSIDDLVDFVVARILDHLDIKQTLMKPWGSKS